MRGTARITFIVAAALLLAGCGDNAVRGEDDQVVEAGDVGAFEVRVGDCFDDGQLSAEASEVQEVDAIPCDQPHDNEVYAIFELPDGDYPGEEAVVEQSGEGCDERFAEFTGTAYQDSQLEITQLFPTEDSWNTLDDREVVCAVYDPSGPVEGSLQGKGESYTLPAEGDCVSEDWTEIDCAEEHYAEIYLIAEIDGEEFPGDEQMDQQASDMCLAEFAGYVGAEYNDSELDYLYFSPDAKTWEQGDRQVICAVGDPSGQITGSVQGSDR
jgi:predicted small secreted protein